MAEQTDSESRKLLRRLRDTLAEDTAGQARLDHIVKLIAHSMQAEVCSIYLFRDADTLELCATEGLNPELCPPDTDAAWRRPCGSCSA